MNQTVASLANAPTVSSDLPVLLSSIGCTAMVAVILPKLGVQEATVGAIASAAGGLPAAVTLWLRQRRKSPATRLRDLVATTDTEAFKPHNPFLVALALSFSMVFVDSLIGSAIGTIVGITAAVAGVEFADVASAFGSSALIIALPTLVIVALVAGRFVSRQLPGRGATKWLLLAAAMTLPIRITIYSLFNIGEGTGDVLGLTLGDVTKSASFFVLVFFLLFWLGLRWGMRTRDSALMARIFRQLLSEDRAALFDLVRSAAAERPSDTGRRS